MGGLLCIEETMPKLDWIGKKAVVNHHREVPFHLLRENPELSVGDPGSGNLLVQGDNLLALKALLPYYAGQVKCIYIDSSLQHRQRGVGLQRQREQSRDARVAGQGRGEGSGRPFAA